MHKNIRIIIWFILFLLGILSYFYFNGMRGKAVMASSKKTKQLSVYVMEAMPQNKTIHQTYIGYVKPIHQVAIHTYISGFIDKVAVRGGEEVKAGELLFVIKQDEYKAQLNLAIAKVAQAQAILENANIYYERMKTAGQKAISKTDLDNAKTAVLTAKAELLQAQADEEVARVNYNYTMIYAPISGLVGDVSITVGDYVFPQSTPLITIIQYNPIRVQFSISDKTYLNETDLGQELFSDWKMYLKLANGKIYNQTGVIKYLNNQINPQTSALTVYSDFNNPDNLLIPNAYVDVILEKQIEDGIFLPQSVVDFTSNGAVVYILSDDSKIMKIPVQVSSLSDGLFYISGGLKSGMRIITNKVSNYQIGQTATPVQGDSK